MKTIISTIILTIALAFCALAQNPTVYSLGSYTGSTATLVANATNTSAFTIACSEYERANFQFTLKADAATPGSGTAQLALFRSIDSTTYETTPFNIIALTLNGTTSVCIATNIFTGGFGVMKGELRNTNAVNLTNVAFKARFSQYRVEAK